MAFDWSGVASAGVGALGSGISGLLSGASSARAAQKAYEYNWNLIKMQQDWQERMSNTAHQREVKDLRAAGLNPILSATGGSGASFGSASAPGMSVTPASFDSPLSSALSLRQQINTNKLTKSNIDKTKSDIDVNDSNIKVNSAMEAKTTQDIINSIAKTEAEVRNLDTLSKQLEEQTKYIGYNAESSRIGAIASHIGNSASARDVDTNININKAIEKERLEFIKRHPKIYATGQALQYLAPGIFGASAVGAGLGLSKKGTSAKNIKSVESPIKIVPKIIKF